MSRTHTSLALAAALATAAVPALAGTTPKGGPNPGLIWHTADSCLTGDGQPIGDTGMLLSGGTTFWMGGVHYAVKSVTYTGAFSGTYDYGMKNGLSGGETVTCDGVFHDAGGDIFVHSTDVPIP